jgi:hypothetical protein
VTLAHDVLTVALADPTTVLALDDIRLATKLAAVRTVVATASDVQEAVNRYYGGGASGGMADTFGALARPDLARRAARAGGAAPAQVAPAVKTPPKVLVVDDDSSIAEVAAAVLQRRPVLT